jgi:hypothetical protein
VILPGAKPTSPQFYVEAIEELGSQPMHSMLPYFMSDDTVTRCLGVSWVLKNTMPFQSA